MGYERKWQYEIYKVSGKIKRLERGVKERTKKTDQRIKWWKARTAEIN